MWTPRADTPLDYARFSVDPSGRWSPTQARRVQDIIAHEAETQGVRFEFTLAGPNWMPRGLLVPYCLKHDIAVVRGQACALCRVK